MKNFLQIGEIAKYYDISLDTLRLYDKIGLLKPAVVKENGYRYYTYNQTDILELILMGKALNIPLKEIKEKLVTPDIADKIALMKLQEEKIEEEFRRLQNAKIYTDYMLKNFQAAQNYSATLQKPVQKRNIDVCICCPKNTDDYPKFTSQWEVCIKEKNQTRRTYGFSMVSGETYESKDTDTVRLCGNFSVYQCHLPYEHLVQETEKLNAAKYYINFLLTCPRDKGDNEYYVDIYVPDNA